MNDKSWRKGAGIALILTSIALWAIIIASLSTIIGDWPVLLQALFYLAAGLVWILPFKPLLRWMEGGPFRR